MRSTFAVRETASLGIMGAPRVPPLNPSESIVLSELAFVHGIVGKIPSPHSGNESLAKLHVFTKYIEIKLSQKQEKIKVISYN